MILFRSVYKRAKTIESTLDEYFGVNSGPKIPNGIEFHIIKFYAKVPQAGYITRYENAFLV